MMNRIISGLSQQFERFVSGQFPDSPKAAVLIVSACTLMAIAMTLGVASAVVIVKSGDIGTGAVTCTVGVCGMVAGLAGWHQQSDPGAAIPGHTETKDTTTITPDISRTASATTVTDSVPASTPPNGRVSGSHESVAGCANQNGGNV